jgi:hypothetical protein
MLTGGRVSLHGERRPELQSPPSSTSSSSAIRHDPSRLAGASRWAHFGWVLPLLIVDVAQIAGSRPFYEYKAQVATWSRVEQAYWIFVLADRRTSASRDRGLTLAGSCCARNKGPLQGRRAGRARRLESRSQVARREANLVRVRPKAHQARQPNARADQPTRARRRGRARDGSSRPTSLNVRPSISNLRPETEGPTYTTGPSSSRRAERRRPQSRAQDRREPFAPTDYRLRRQHRPQPDWAGDNSGLVPVNPTPTSTPVASICPQPQVLGGYGKSLHC